MTATEQILSSMFQDILGTEPNDIDANFFTSGGDSLSAMLIISRIRSHYGVEISIEDFFIDDPTVRSLAMRIDSVFSV